MCGIAGFAAADRERILPEERLWATARLLHHRGPDGPSVWQEPGAGIVHTRLAIIDRDHGSQPMFTTDGRYAVAFNGEIYNHHDLHRELEALGYRLRTQCDTEVLPYLYAHFGPDMVGKLRGMFAFAILDRQTGEVFLGRDRFGKKPLYTAVVDGTLFFASTVDALAEIGALELRPNPQALFEYLVLQYVPSPLSPLQGVTKIPPGYAGWWRDGKLDTTRYWTPPSRTGRDILRKAPGAADLARLREAIGEAVRVRLESEVPLGIFLSGGIDSSVIVAEAASSGLRPNTFSVGFRKEQLDETPYARLVAGRFETNHTELIADESVESLFEAFTTFYDEPFADSSALATLAVARAASEHVTVVLTGDGGDEMFGGYARYQWFRRSLRLRRPLGPLADVAGLAAQWMGERAGSRRVAGAGRILRDPWGWYRDALFHFAPAEAAGLIRPDFAEGVDWRSPTTRLDALWASGRAGLSDLLWVDEQTYLPDDLLTKMDRATMAFSLEARSPLLDHELAALCATYPGSWLFAHQEGKGILRQAYREMLPAEILERRKQGFGVPIAEWLRGPLRPSVEELLLSADGPLWEWLDRTRASGLVTSFLQGGLIAARQIWNLLALAGWAEHHVRHRVAVPAGNS